MSFPSFSETKSHNELYEALRVQGRIVLKNPFKNEALRNFWGEIVHFKQTGPILPLTQ